MPDLYRYQAATTPGPNGSRARPLDDGWMELAEVGGWVYVAGEGVPDVPGATPEPTELTPGIVAASRRHQFLLELLAQKRWEAETGGVEWSGWPVATDVGSQGKLTAAYQAAATGLRADGGAWKFADGIARTMTNAQLQEMALTVMAHVQACFDNEAAIAEQIRASALPDEAWIQGGWPLASLR
ncbi:DUF4376 domain-containing protein [Thiococcus pfennigii]|uniref:DUF4376 domain-containing protein n=1 Tax=Thiococcus pfennigii TaxID=1057 RepID=UPI001905FDE6|nr:DUF4376 domain-containing protein [Thiococcus pfennigii]MBK1699744.1 hypothetical protein [Thiococcus pfennigii]